MNKTSLLSLIALLSLAALAALQIAPEVTALVAINRFLGVGAFFLLSLSLIIGPLAVLNPKEFAAWIEPRRAIGIASFGFLFLHFWVTFIFYFQWNASFFLYLPILIALPAYFVFLILTLISSDWATKKLGAGLWKNLQRAAYPAFLLSFAHFVLQISAHSKNLSEILSVLFGIAAIIMQILGFAIVLKRKAEAKKKEKQGPEERAKSSDSGSA